MGVQSPDRLGFPACPAIEDITTNTGDVPGHSTRLPAPGVVSPLANQGARSEHGPRAPRLLASDVVRHQSGGPGGPAVSSPPGVRKAMKEVGPRYDIIGFAPRFVGRSTPLDCRWPVGTHFASAGLSRAGFELPGLLVRLVSGHRLHADVPRSPRPDGARRVKTSRSTPLTPGPPHHSRNHRHFHRPPLKDNATTAPRTTSSRPRAPGGPPAAGSRARTPVCRSSRLRGRWEPATRATSR